MTHKIVEKNTLLTKTLNFYDEQIAKLQYEKDILNKLMSQLENKFENFHELQSSLTYIINDNVDINNILLFQVTKINEELAKSNSEIETFLNNEVFAFIKLSEIIKIIIKRIHTKEMITLIDSNSQPKHNLYIKYYEMYNKSIYSKNIEMYKQAMISINNHILNTISEPSYNDIKNDMLYKQYHLTLQYRKDIMIPEFDDKTLMLLMLLYIQVINNTVVNFVIKSSENSKSSDSSESSDRESNQI